MTRAKHGMNARRVYSTQTNRATGVICDQAIALNGFYISKDYPQHLRIKKFLGTSENAVKTQIWCAVSTYVLITIVKKELHFNASLYTWLQILSASIFEKTQFSCALQPDAATMAMPPDANQLILFDF